jgi:hypothetical protein
MNGKITLVTPPDIYQNSNLSILFIHLSDQDQEIVSKWLAERELISNVNFYVYSGEPNISWVFCAMGCCQHKYLDVDGVNDITRALSGYMLSKDNFYYKTTDENLAAVYSHINTNRITAIEQFLERALSDKNS